MANNVLYLDLEVEADVAGIILAEKDAFDGVVTRASRSLRAGPPW